MKKILLLVSMLILVCQFALAQNSISGTVTSDTGESLPGANVLVKGTTQGNITDANGRFTIQSVPANAVLEISSIGYQTQEITVGNQTTFNISMVTDIRQLSEIVVVGYGSQTKRDLTGAISTVDTEGLKDLPVPQFAQKLQGQLAGVQINQTTGVPGQGMNIQIRGAASFNSSTEPLYVVDGFPIITGNDNAGINNINPNEIESITILKDASSTALYGSRGANGVVLITTKKASAGSASVNFSAYYGVQTVPQKGRPEVMNAKEFNDFQAEILEDIVAEGGTLNTTQQSNLTFFRNFDYSTVGGEEGIDWYNYMLRPSPVQDYSVTVTTGTNRFRTAIVGSYFNQDGIVINSGFERYSVRMNSEFDVNDNLTFGANVAPTFSVSNTGSTDGAFFGGGMIYNALLSWPIAPYQLPDGTFPLNATVINPATGQGVTAFGQPNAVRTSQDVIRLGKRFRMLTNGFLNYKITDGLTFRSSINVDFGTNYNQNINPSTVALNFNTSLPQQNSGTLSRGNSVSWLNENTLTFAKTFGDHSLDILAGYTVQKFLSENMSLSFIDFAVDDLPTPQSGIQNGMNSGVNEWSLLSYIGRAQYNYQGKYLLTGSIRRDGSSRFGAGNRWGVFPSFSAGWIVSDEAFMPDISGISFLKLRGSWGVTGNNNIGNYDAQALLGVSNIVFDGQQNFGATPSRLANDNLGWESTAQTDIGIDVGLVDDRINLSYDYYKKTTTDMLYNVPLPGESGFGSFLTNLGEIQLWGHEITINSRNLVGALTWNTSFNISFNNSEVIDIAPNVDEFFTGGHVVRVGEPIGQFWGLEFDGIFRDDEEWAAGPQHSRSGPGTIRYVDQDGDNQVDNANNDRTVIGNPNPDFIYGITNTLRFKGFDLNIIGSGSQGNDIYRNMDQGTTNLDGVFNVLAEVKDRWRSPSNPGAGIYGTTRPGTTGRERDWASSRFVHDGSFFTIKNIALGYNLPVTMMNVSWLKNARVFGSIQQVYVFTKYRGNPEVNTSGGGSAEAGIVRGHDNSAYPIPRTFTFGVNLGL